MSGLTPFNLHVSISDAQHDQLTPPSSLPANVDHCCYAWNKLVAQPWTVMSIGLRDWAHGF